LVVDVFERQRRGRGRGSVVAGAGAGGVVVGQNVKVFDVGALDDAKRFFWENASCG